MADGRPIELIVKKYFKETYPVNAINASAVFSINDAQNAANDETATIDDVVYTFKTDLTGYDVGDTLGDTLGDTSGDTGDTSPAPIPYEVKIGANAAATVMNLYEAIIGEADGEGVNYSEGTWTHPTVTATLPTGRELTVTANITGRVGNSITVSTDVIQGQWESGDTGDTDPEVTTLENGEWATLAPYDMLGYMFAYNSGVYMAISSKANDKYGKNWIYAKIEASLDDFS